MKHFAAGMAVLCGLWFVGGCGTEPVKTSATTAMIWQDQQKNDFSAIVETAVSPSGLELNIKGDDLFKPGTTKISMDGMLKIDAIADVLVKYPKDRVIIQVFTDSSGSVKRNLRLSQKRADAIKEELSTKGVTVDSMTATGMGISNPIATNDTPEGRVQNRRAELDITMP
jgi:outer membrane protein OmpA-like peptidoglycan-associated protein